MSADQWLEEGDCSKCRRSKYCSKPCKRHKIATKKRMITNMNMVLKTIGTQIIKDELRKFVQEKNHEKSMLPSKEMREDILKNVR